jgi:prepilin-type processing-associated H-X9-DG protein
VWGFNANGAGMPYYKVVAFHQNMTNIAWADGHVKSIRLEELRKKSSLPGRGYCHKYFSVNED